MFTLKSQTGPTASVSTISLYCASSLPYFMTETTDLFNLDDSLDSSEVFDIKLLSTYNLLFRPEDGSWRLFYHYVGATPGSTELLPMLKRLLLAMQTVTVSSSHRLFSIAEESLYKINCLYNDLMIRL